ncbi:unnamed protein product, partial [Adineta steineri]
MGFFIHDLHQQIRQLHGQQLPNYCDQLLVVYRGQGLLKTDFDKLKKTKGGLISFNNFLSTSVKPDVSLFFAESASGNIDMVGILFIMTIDPHASSTPFASIKGVSSFETEEEILFSMHTVFRVGAITQMNNNDQLYQVELQLTTNDDEQLRKLTKCISEEVEGETGWERLGRLLVKTGHFDKAEELCKVLLEQTSKEDEEAMCYNYLVSIKYCQGDYERAIEYYEKSHRIWEKTLSDDHPLLVISYNNIGDVYYSMGDYSKAISFFEKALEIREKTLPANHHSFATSYNNIGAVYSSMGDYSKAISFYDKALKIREKTLPNNHPALATSYNNIGDVYDSMREYSKALLLYEKALEIREKTLPNNHPGLANSYNNIGLLYSEMREHSKALSFHDKALEIQEKTHPNNHPDLATSYNNIGGVYYSMGDYSKAMSFFEKA